MYVTYELLSQQIMLFAIPEEIRLDISCESSANLDERSSLIFSLSFFFLNQNVFYWSCNWQFDDIFLIFPRKQNLTFHANCLHWRQFQYVMC